MRRSGCGCGGCLGSLLLGVLVVAGLAYFLVYRPVQAFLTGFGTPAPAQQTQAQQAETQAALTRADVQRFVRVRRSVRTAMGDSFSGVEKVFRDIQLGQSPNALTVLGVLRDATGSVGVARSAQAGALAREGMTLNRYAYVRAEVNRALGVPDIDFQKVASAVRSGQVPDLNTSVRPPDARSAPLVQPFRSELEVTAPLGLLGL